jgi:putative addiction module component (TIGR02574 family)
MNTSDAVVKEFNRLSVERRIELVHRLWAEIGAEVPVHAWQRDVVEQRIRDADEDDDLGEPWDQVMRELVDGA